MQHGFLHLFVAITNALFMTGDLDGCGAAVEDG